MTDLQTRLFSRLVTDPSGCMLWTGAKTRDGYGSIRIDGRSVDVHRIVYEMLAGPIPDGLHLDHLCRVRHCANISHLEPVTCRENILRGTGISAVNALKTHCGKGHEFDEANTYIYRGRRACRACNRAAVIRYQTQRGTS